MLDDETTQLSNAFKVIFAQLKSLDNCIDTFGKLIVETVKINYIYQRIQTIPGFGSMVSSAYFNEVGNGSNDQRGNNY